jgi:hypothetical protein
MRDLDFEWDDDKADANLKKHKVSFEEARTVFKDELQITIDDPDHSDEEDRFATIGMSSGARLLVIIHVGRDERIRIISARKVARFEQRIYESK